MKLSYLDESREPFIRVTVDGVIKLNISRSGISYWKDDDYMFYVPLYRVGDVRIYESEK